MKEYTSPEVAEVGSASEVVLGDKIRTIDDNDGTGQARLPFSSILDVD